MVSSQMKIKMLQCRASWIAIALAGVSAPELAFAQTAPAQQASSNSDTPIPVAATPTSGDTQETSEQDARQTPADTPSDSSDIVVTGTSIRGIKPVGSENVTLDRGAIVATGLTNVADVARTLPQLQGLGFDQQPTVAQNGGANNTHGTTLNLRGLGQNATLLLVNGHRLTPTGTTNSFTDANAVPVAALEQIQVVPDGASAIYGSDAVAGVVNYILRRDFKGVEITLRDMTSDHYGERGGSITAGTTWSHIGGLGKGNILVSYDYDDQDSMLRGSSRYLRQDLSPFGGIDNRLQGNSATPGRAQIALNTGVPNTVIPNASTFRYFTVPAGSTGVGLTAGSLLVNQPSIVDSSDYVTYIPNTRRHQVTAFLNQELTGWLSFFAEGFYTNRLSLSTSYPTNNLTVTAASPFYISGIPGVAQGAPLTVQYNFVKDIGLQTFRNPDSNYTITTGFNADLGRWQGNAYVTVGHDSTCGACVSGNALNITAANALIAAGVFNPFDTRPIDPAIVARFTGTNYQHTTAGLRDIVVKFNGPLLNLPAGAVRAAVGGESIHSSQFVISSAYQGAANTNTVLSQSGLTRDVYAAFGELFVPLVSEDMDIPFIRSLSFDGAVRYEHYSDFGSTTNPKLGIVWEPVDGLSLRGSWGTSFRAPALPDINPGVGSAYSPFPVVNNSGDPSIPIDIPGPNLTNALLVIGSPSKLSPETAKTYSLGVDFAPKFLPGFKASLSYFNIHYNDQILALNLQGLTFLTTASNRQLYSNFIIPTPAPAGCVNGNPSTYNQTLRQYLNFVNVFQVAVPAPCSIRVVLNGQNANASNVFQDGLDFSSSYSFQTRFGSFSIGDGFTYNLNLKRQITPDAPLLDVNNLINFPVKFRNRGTFNWTVGPITSNVYVNTVGSYTNNIPITVAGVTRPSSDVPAWTTVDFGLTVRLTNHYDRPVGKEIRLSLNVQNIFDKRPPIVLSTNGNAIDNQNSNPFGPIWRFQASKKF
jgi:iron complex outermembrane receptor protein